jgi:biopolymer transport protein ExbD
MRKNPYDEHETYDEINVVPLLDLAWNLLIVFMIVVTASVQGININLPKASAAVSKIKPSTKAITITAIFRWLSEGMKKYHIKASSRFWICCRNWILTSLAW